MGILWLIFQVSMTVGEFLVPYTRNSKHIKAFEKGVASYAPKLELRECDKRYCMFAKESILPNELIIELPLKESITEPMDCPWHYENITSTDRVIISILYEKYGPKSNTFVHAAVHYFPVEFDIPYNWTMQESALYNQLKLWTVDFQYDDYLVPCMKFRNAFSSVYHNIPDAAFEIESWKWAHSVKITRGFGVKLSDFNNMVDTPYGGKDADSVINTIFPLIDMLNHDQIRTTDTPRGLFRYRNHPPRIEYYSYRDYSKGDEVFNFYGTFTHIESVMRYGFILENNLDNAVKIPVGGTVNCRGNVYLGNCYYSLDNRGVNADFIVFLAESLTGSPLNTELSVALNGFLKLDFHTIRSSKEPLYKVSLESCLKYRKSLVDLYNQKERLGLRTLRRNHSTQNQTKARLIYQISELERTTYHRALRLIERRLLAGFAALY